LRHESRRQHKKTQYESVPYRTAHVASSGNIRVINRRANSWAVVGPAVQKEKAASLLGIAAYAYPPLRMAPLRLRRLGKNSGLDRSLHIRT